MRSPPALSLTLLATLSLPALDGGAGAQAYDPRTQSPATLLAAPADGVAYHESRLRARALVREKKYAGAEPLAERLVRDYPRDGENWVLLGEVKRGLEKHAEAAAAYETAGPLVGWQNYSTLPEIYAAGEHLAAGNRRAALDLLRRSVFEHRSLYRDALIRSPGFAALRDDPEYREIVGSPDTTGWGSAVRWNLSRDVFDGRREMSPHVPVQLTARAYFAGEDPALDAVFRLIRTAR